MSSAEHTDGLSKMRRFNSVFLPIVDNYNLVSDSHVAMFVIESYIFPC